MFLKASHENEPEVNPQHIHGAVEAFSNNLVIVWSLIFNYQITNLPSYQILQVDGYLHHSIVGEKHCEEYRTEVVATRIKYLERRK